ncbi:hypothetical protein [Pleionea sp. CnH1-48]|uniref:hypothetical protein n=1 Tax=Pleionea sp. CnH1-48 TaxID=2954494 RepID=UPI00209698EF|nr:hypothetical protein [Pleionea sp. CnH1-48]MCO7223204.1 hypothetical protein [Pleionea sp. CnH1-48]
MIKDKELAKKIVAVVDECSKQLNSTICEVKDNCSKDEFNSYRKAAGFVMGYIYTDIVAPIYSKHPELEPDELKN